MLLSKFLWVGVMLAALLAGLLYVLASGAPQQAAAAAMVIIPYCLARAWDKVWFNQNPIQDRSSKPAEPVEPPKPVVTSFDADLS